MGLLVPVNDDFVEVVAKAIARNRVSAEAAESFREVTGINIESTDLEDRLDRIFEALWEGSSAEDQHQKIQYRVDARAAIAAINLKLLTLTE